MSTNKALDKFYTTTENVDHCLRLLHEVVDIDTKQDLFLEPSAGSGAFLTGLQNIGAKYLAYDIAPENTSFPIVKADYLATKLEGDHITIGNPPYGHRGKLAIEFFNHAASHSKVIAFVVPLNFRKYSVHKHLDSNFKLAGDFDLLSNKFIFENKSRVVRSCFQVWVKTLKEDQQDLRITSAPKTKHPDFEMFLHNNTYETLKYFNKKEYGWNFAVHRQGYYDYSQFIVREQDLVYNRQYIFFKATDKKILEKIKKIDFEKLAQLNTTTPGFGKADIVKKYEEMI